MSDNQDIIYDLQKGQEKYDFRNKQAAKSMVIPGLNESIIREISESKSEPQWMLEQRLNAFKIYETWHEPNFGVDLSNVDLSKIVTYIHPRYKKATSWDDVPPEIKETFEKLGVPQAERLALSGVGAQYDSEVVYHNIKTELESQGIIFLDTESAVRKYPDLVKKYFMKAFSPSNHRYSALNNAIWSGGTFLYIPPNVDVKLPLQAYFRMNNEGMGQFEHSIIIADEGSRLHFVEGCSAPYYNAINFHAGMVEIFVKKGARVKYSTIQNWSKNTFNLNSKRAIVDQDGIMEWVTGSMGSHKSMTYPTSILRGKGAKNETIAVSFAGPNQHLDTGSKVFMFAPYTSSTVDSRSISLGGGWSFYRGWLKVDERARGAKATVRCNALMLDNESRSDTIPLIEVFTDDADVGHEAKVGRISDEQIFYLMSRGMSEKEAKSMIVRGFIEPFAKELPLEYAIEMNKLLNLEVESTIG